MKERIIWTEELIQQQGYSIPQLLREFGCDRIRERGDRYEASSPFREDKHPSFWLYKNPPMIWQDPAEGLQGDIDRLCWLTKNQSLARFLKYNLDEKRSSAFLPKRKHPEGESTPKRRVFVRTESYDPSEYELIVEGTGIDYNLFHCDEALAYARSRFMNDEFIDYFHVGYSANNFIYLNKKGTRPSLETKRLRFYKRLIVPILEGGVIASVEGRDITRHQEHKCIYPASYEGNVGGSSYRSLFNIDNLDRKKTLIICEGIMDTVRIWQSITRNVTCTYGSSIKARQREVLKEFDDIIIFSDSDAGGLTAMEMMDKYYPKDFKVAQLPSGDPGDEQNSVDMLKRAIDEATPFPKWILQFTGRISQ